MNAPVSTQESRAKGQITYYKGWIYATICGHQLGFDQVPPQHGLCHSCRKWAGTRRIPTERFQAKVDPRPLELFRTLRDAGRLDLYRKMMGGT